MPEKNIGRIYTVIIPFQTEDENYDRHQVVEIKALDREDLEEKISALKRTVQEKLNGASSIK